MVNFIEFLNDAVHNMDAFSNDINTIFISHEGNKIIATGNHPKRRMYYFIESILEESVGAPGCFGSIGYLKSILSTSLMKENPSLDIQYTKDKPTAINKITFRSNRLEVHYQCINPDTLNDKDRIKRFPRPNDALFFPISKTLRKEFEEVAKLSVPKSDVRLFQMSYDGNYVRATFGEGPHTGTFILSSDVTGTITEKFTKYLDLDRFRVIFKLGADNENAKAAFSPKVFWMDFSTSVALHTIAIPTIIK